MTVVCVLGSGRSGTSAIANLVQELGVYLGPDNHLQLSTTWNPEGCYEHMKLMGINQIIFKRYGGSSVVLPIFPPGWHRSTDLDDLRSAARAAIEEDFTDQPLWGWKDPTACLTLPFWQDIIGDMRYVICVRNPVDVVASLEAQWKWPFHVAIEAWLERYMSVLLYTAGSPRLFISYDDYFQAPEEQVRRLAKFLGRPFPRQGSERYQRIFGTVREDLRNFRAPIDKVLEDTRLASGDKYFYLGLQSACEAPMGTDRIDLQVMSDQYRAALRARFRTLRVYFEAYAKQAEADIKSAEMAAEEAQAAATALKSELARRGDVTAEERMSALRADIRSTLAEGLTDLRRDLEAHADSLRAELLMDLPDHAENGHHSATSNGNGSHNGHTHP